MLQHLEKLSESAEEDEGTVLSYIVTAVSCISMVLY